MEAIEVDKKMMQKEVEVIFSKQVTIDYDVKINASLRVDLCKAYKFIKEISDDIEKARIRQKGEKKAEIVLLDFGEKISESQALKFLKEAGFESAGIHETLEMSKYLPELSLRGEFSITALRDQWLDQLVEFIPTIYSARQDRARIMMCFAHDLPFKHSYFLGIKYV